MIIYLCGNVVSILHFLSAKYYLYLKINDKHVFWRIVFVLAQGAFLFTDSQVPQQNRYQMSMWWIWGVNFLPILLLLVSNIRETTTTNTWKKICKLLYLLDILIIFQNGACTINIQDINDCASRVRVMVFNTTFNNISVISWQSVLLVKETGIPRENQRPAASHWQTTGITW